MTGPLSGVRIVEFEAIGPVPHAVAMLTSMGADVVRVRRPVMDSMRDPNPFTGRTISADLREPSDVAGLLELIARADVLVEGYRPGVLERRGLGPDVLLARNPGLVFARMTGWGQTGPRATEAGHDINYIGLAGALALIGDEASPAIPLNLVGDYGGGSMVLVIGILAALLERTRSGRGQVVDAAIVDGTSAMLGVFGPALERGGWRTTRGTNVLDGGAPYYRTYRCSDGKFVAVGAIEEPFYRTMIEILGLGVDDLPDRSDRAQWPALRDIFAAEFATRTRDEWTTRFLGTDACVTPVLDPLEARADAHLAARGVHGPDGAVAGAPRFSRSATTHLGGDGAGGASTIAAVTDSWPYRSLEDS